MLITALALLTANVYGAAGELVAGQVLEAEVQAEQMASYQISLEKGDYLRLEIDQVSAFVQLSIEDSQNQILAQSSKYQENAVPFLLSLIAPSAGRYQVKISALGFFDEATKASHKAQSGKFRLRLVDRLSAAEYEQRNRKIDADQRIDWLKKTAHQISLAPESEDFTGLQPIKEAIGDARIVMLGEQNHGTAQTYLGKTRLVKFLHQEMGFDMLAMEGGIIEIPWLQTSIESGSLSDWDWLGGIYRIWAGAQEFEPLKQYLRETQTMASPLVLWGVDNQFRTGDPTVLLKRELEKVFGDHDLSPESERPQFFEMLPKVIRGVWYRGKIPPPSDDEKDAFYQDLDWLIHQINEFEQKSPSFENRFCRQVLLSLKAHAPKGFATREERASNARIFSQARDIQMGQNLAWLVCEFPNKKIIVWAASSHNAKNYSLVQHPYPSYRENPYRSMGHEFVSSVSEDVYSIMFTAYQGTYGNKQFRAAFSGSINSDQHEDLEFEELMTRAGFTTAFLDLKWRKPGDAWLHQMMRARPFGHTSILGPWPQVTDGFVFTRDVNELTTAKFLVEYFESRK